MAIAPVNQGAVGSPPIIRAPQGASSSVVPFVRPTPPLAAPISAPPTAGSSIAPFVRPTAPLNTTPVSAPVNPVAAPVAAPVAFKTPILPYIPQPQVAPELLPPGAYYGPSPFGIGPAPTVPFVPRPANVPAWAWPFPEPPLPNQMPSDAMEQGPVVTPAVPPPFTGGQGAGVRYVAEMTTRTAIGSTSPRLFYATGPITAWFQTPLQPFQARVTVVDLGGARTYSEDHGWIIPGGLDLGPWTRLDGQPDTAGDPPGAVAPELAPNPARAPGFAPRPIPPLPLPRFPLPEPQPAATPQPDDLPWPQTPAPPVPSPIRPINPTLPETPDRFQPLPPIDPVETPTRPQNPPFNPEVPAPIAPILPGVVPPTFPSPVNPTQPNTTPRPATPFLPGINPGGLTGLVPTPIQLPNGTPQGATTPSGQQIGQSAQTNPNVRPTGGGVVQAPTIPAGCCPDLWGQKNNEQLMALRRAVGVDDLPASVPDQIAKDVPVQIVVDSLAKFQTWQIQQLDGVMGRWPQQIPIPTPAGPVNVGMPNMAEAVAELVGMMVSQQVTATQILNTSSRTLAQAGSATQQAHLAHLTAKANAEFLGFESRPSVVDMPLAYTPGLNPFEGLLNESTAKVKGFENTDGQDLKSILAELLQAAAIIRAVYWRKLDTKGDLKSQLRKNIRGQGDFVDKAAASEGDRNDWEAYLRQVEEGFRSATGDDTAYGRNPGEGPKINDRSPKKGK